MISLFFAQNSQMKSGSRQDSMEGLVPWASYGSSCVVDAIAITMLLATGEASQNGNTVNGFQNGGLVNHTMAVVPMSAAAGPITNLNMGMEYWVVQIYPILLQIMDR